MVFLDGQQHVPGWLAMEPPANRPDAGPLRMVIRLCVMSCCLVAPASAQSIRPLPPVEPVPAGPPISGPAIPGPVVEDPQVGPEGLELSAIGLTPEDAPSWYNPLSWFLPKDWDGSFEVGINGTQGNARASSLRTGFDLSRETDLTNLDIDFTYAKSEDDGRETQHNALLRSDWDVQLPDPSKSWFNKVGIEYDEFRDFSLRLFLNTGFGHLFVDNDTTELRGRLGAGTSREFGGEDDAWKPEANFGSDFAQQLTKRQKLSLVCDYYPNFEDFGDFRVIADASWEVVLDKSSNLSFKLGIIDRYDSTPGNAKPNDVDYKLLFLWKL